MRRQLFGRVDPGFFFSRRGSNVGMPDARVLPRVEVGATCNRHGCPEADVCGSAETLFIFAKSNWALVISSSILRFSFFFFSSSERDSIDDAGGG